VPGRYSIIMITYLNDLAKETLPFMYQISIEGIRDKRRNKRILEYLPIR